VEEAIVLRLLHPSAAEEVGMDSPAQMQRRCAVRHLSVVTRAYERMGLMVDSPLRREEAQARRQRGSTARVI